MADAERSSILNDAERESLERPVKQQARALMALSELATLVGASPDKIAVIAAGIRHMSKGEAKAAWQILGDANEQLSIVSFSEVDPDAAGDEPAEQEQASDDIALSPEGPEEAEESELPKERFDLGSVQSFITAINSKAQHEYLTVPDQEDEIDADELIALLALFGARSKRPNMVKKNVDIIMESLRTGTKGVMSSFEHITSETQLYSLRNQTTKKIAEYLDQVVGASDAEETTDELVDRGEVADESYEENPVQDSPSVDHLGIDGEDTSDVEPALAEPEVAGQPIEREPMSVQIIEKFMPLFTTDVNKEAFKGLIDPENRGDFTAAKQLVIDQLRALVGKISPSGQIINDLDVPADQRASLRYLLGIGFRQGDNPVEKQPVPLSKQIQDSRRSRVDGVRYADGLYQAMDALYDLLTAPSEAEHPAPVQVLFSADGSPSLG